MIYQSITKFIKWIKFQLSKHRWGVIAIFGFVSALFEFAEFISKPASILDPAFLVELILQGIVLPSLLVILQLTEIKKESAINTLSLMESISFQINNAKDWNELIGLIIQFPRNIVPLTRISLWIRNPDTNQFELEQANIFEEMNKTIQIQISQEAEDIQNYHSGFDRISKVKICNCSVNPQALENQSLKNRYCLPLTNANSVVGMLYFYLPISYKLLEDQQKFLNNFGTQIGLALTEAVLKREAMQQKQALENERQRIANDLHDTLGQDLAYLRNKIEQLSRDHSFQNAPFIMQEFHRMSLVANNANQTVRNLLAVTRSDSETSLEMRLLTYSKAIAERANFTISVSSQGIICVLDPQTQFQLFLIFREILANIEKHANARHVTITLTWSDEELILETVDDGCGFQNSLVDKTGHFGLTIIETRVRGLNGLISLTSEPNKGTKISIRLPINRANLLSINEGAYEYENSVGR